MSKVWKQQRRLLKGLLGEQFHTFLRCLRGSKARSHTDPWWLLLEPQLCFTARSEVTIPSPAHTGHPNSFSPSL